MKRGLLEQPFFFRLFVVVIVFAILVFGIMGLARLVKADDAPKKLPEGQNCSNTFDTDAAHKCACMSDMKCPMKKPEPCYDEYGDCPQPDNGPDSTKCISPYCAKGHCKCANPCKS
jgi:hypothetical protein